MSQPPYLYPRRQPNEPTEKYGCAIPRKNASPRNTRKSWQHFVHLRASTAAGRYEQEALHKAKVGTNRLRVQRWIIQMHIIMTAANCNPAVASRHHGARRLAQAARVEDAYGGHGVGVEQNGRPEHGRSVLLQLTARAKLSGRSRCCSEARTWRTSRANLKRCRPNNEKR